MYSIYVHMYSVYTYAICSALMWGITP